MRTLKSFTVKKIDRKNQDIVVDLVIEKDGKEETVKQTIHYANQVSYYGEELRQVRKDWTDESGRVHQRFVDKKVRVLKHRQAFDMGNKEAFEAEVRNYAIAYMAGLDQQEAEIIPVASEIDALVGVKNT